MRVNDADGLVISANEHLTETEQLTSVFLRDRGSMQLDLLPVAVSAGVSKTRTRSNDDTG